MVFADQHDVIVLGCLETQAVKRTLARELANGRPGYLSRGRTALCNPGIVPFAASNVSKAYEKMRSVEAI